jgi:ABC-type uncharacterized transport system involved in gliding motility auxiliary subunit
MKHKQFENVLYSTIGVIAMFVLLFAVNGIASRAKIRADLTEEKAFTLSDGTKALLKKLDTKVKIRFYCTQGENSMPVFLRNYAQRVEDILGEYRQASKGNIVIEKYNPTPDSDAEDSANLDHVEGQMIPQTGDRIYLGLSISLLDEKVALPFLSPERERLLEYDITRAIAQVMNPTKPVVGVMSAFPVFGQQMNPMMMMQMPQQQRQEPWIFINELRRDFNVKEVPMTADQIDEDVSVLLVVHPRDISEAAQYAIDQFVMRGGKLIAFVDPHAHFDQQRQPQNPMMPGMAGRSSLDRLFSAWGIQIESGKVVADVNFVYRNQQGAMPAVLALTRAGVNPDDIVTSQIGSLLVPFAGAITGTPPEGVTRTVLLHSTANSALVDGFLAGMPGDHVMKDFKASGTEHALAILLVGKFKTAFPEGKPGSAAGDDENAEEKSSAASLKESAQETAVAIIADADMLHDQIAAQVQQIFGQRIVIPGPNLHFIQSLVEHQAGDSHLINLRSRVAMHRPFTRVKEMEGRAQEQYRARIKELEEDLAQTQQKVNQLQSQKDNTQQRFILSPDQQAELAKFREKEALAKKDLKELRKGLRKETDSLVFWTKVINIGAMPLAVAFTGLVLAMVKRKRTAAK